MKRVAYHRLAAAELIKSDLFYDERQLGLGDDFLRAIDAALTIIQKQPNLGRRGQHGTLSYRPKRFPFRIIYQIQGDTVWIVAVAHLSRRPGYWVRRSA